MVHWWIQEGSFPDPGGVQRLIYAATEAGADVVVETYARGQRPGLPPSAEDGPVVVFGGIGTVRDILRQGLPHRPLAWFDEPGLRCSTYYAHYGPLLLQRVYSFYPFAELIRLRDFVFDAYGADGKVFLRPDENNKSFTGQVVAREAFGAWHSFAEGDCSAQDLCVVARPERLLGEWRFIVADGKVVAGSRYRDEGGIDVQPTFPAEAGAFAEKVAGTWSPHPVFCVDVAKTGEGEYRLVEIGSVNCAGFYACDLHEAVVAIHRVAEREWAEGPPRKRT